MRYKALFVASFLLFSFSLVVSASLEDCEEIHTPGERDRCYLNNAVNISDCFSISRTSTKEDCLDKFFQYFDKEEQCDEIPMVHRGRCLTFVLYNRDPKNISSCYSLHHTDQKDCIAFYIQKNGIKDLNYCLNVKEEFQRDCAYRAASNRYGFGPFVENNKSGQECQKYRGRIKEGCEDYFKRVEASKKVVGAISGLFGSILGSIITTFVLFGLFALLIIVLIIGAIVVIIVLLLRKRDEKKNKEEKNQKRK